jgi:long-chain acyl-CoA synthetase
MLLCSNRIEAMEVFAATLRGGYRLVPVNWRLTEGEIAYLLENSDATALFAEVRSEAGLAAARDRACLKTCVAIGGEAAGALPYAETLDAYDGADIADPQIGHVMFYTSGTTGRPKGVYKPALSNIRTAEYYRFDGDQDVHLCVCPTYHGAGLSLDTRSPMQAGVPVVYLDKWDAEEVLQTIQQRRITQGHMVPIMFQRLLALPEHVRRRYDLSSLRRILHGAAPCPPQVKRAMIDWLGPIIYEYYGATEGIAGLCISAEDWLRRPGSVGKARPAIDIRILSDDGRPCATGEAGVIYFPRPSDSPFQYYKDPEKTAAAYDQAHFTTGDIGHLDEDGYLYLIARTAECIISGGVNIYPQEIDNEILKHPAVEDCATVGVPNDEWGEEVKAVVQVRPDYSPDPELAGEIIASLRGALAAYKIPRSIDFVDALPRNGAGKVERSKLRARYWADRGSQI